MGPRFFQKNTNERGRQLTKWHTRTGQGHLREVRLAEAHFEADKPTVRIVSRERPSVYGGISFTKTVIKRGLST